MRRFGTSVKKSPNNRLTPSAPCPMIATWPIVLVMAASLGSQTENQSCAKLQQSERERDGVIPGILAGSSVPFARSLLTFRLLEFGLMPQRFLRPGLRTSPRWNKISHTAARLYIAILTLVDDYGRYDGRPAVLWADAFAVWNDQNPDQIITRQVTAADCCQLAAEKLLEFYEIDGRQYLQVLQWQERARNKSKWPDPKTGKRLPMAADGCQNLPPSPSPSVLDNEARSSAAVSSRSRSDSSIPKLSEFMDYILKVNPNVERSYIKDKWLAQEQKSPPWGDIGNWYAWADRVIGWWHKDGKASANNGPVVISVQDYLKQEAEQYRASQGEA